MSRLNVGASLADALVFGAEAGVRKGRLYAMKA